MAITPYNAPKRGLMQRMSEFWSNNVSEPIQEIIGRVGHRLYTRFPARVSVDHTQADAEYWDHLRRGKKAGFEIGGLFAKPIVEILTSWVFGDGVTVTTGHENTDDKLSEFINDTLLMLITTHEDMLALGDAYIIVDADGSLTMVPSAQVEIEVSDVDHKEIIRATITSLDTETGIEIKDVYTATERTRTIRRGASRSRYGRRDRTAAITQEKETYPNLIGRIPVIHWANDRSANEVYGHPIYEALLTLFAEYDDVIRKGLDGVKIMGNPTPTFEDVNPQSAQRSDRDYTKTYQATNDTSYTDDVAEWSPQEVVYTSGKFSYKSPGNFTPNTVDMLKKLFQVMLQHTQIPEWVWGGAIASSNASVDAQLPAFAKFINTRRLKAEAPLRELIEVWLLTVSLFTQNIRTNEKLSFEWSNLIPENEDIRLKWAQYLDGKGYIQKATAVRLSNLVENAEEEVSLAQQEMIDFEREMQAQIEADIERQMQQREERLQANDSNQERMTA